VKKIFGNDIVTLVKIQIYSNLFFVKIKKIRFFVKRLEQILSRLMDNFFENIIVLLVKIQIYSNLRNGSPLIRGNNTQG
jgi:hypothetical protein